MRGSFVLILYSLGNNSKSNTIPVQAWGFQEGETLKFQDNRQIKVVTLSTLRTIHLYPQEIFRPISVRGRVDSRAIMLLEGLK